MSRARRYRWLGGPATVSTLGDGRGAVVRRGDVIRLERLQLEYFEARGHVFEPVRGSQGATAPRKHEEEVPGDAPGNEPEGNE